MVIHFSGWFLYFFFLVYFGIFIFLKFIKKKNITYIFFFSILYLYLYFVIRTTQFPIYVDDVQREAFGGQNVWKEMNYIPFKYGFSLSSLYNIIMTIPLGFGIPFLVKSNIRKVFLIALCTTLLIEAGQLISALYAGYTFRYVDINDVILNILGALIGYLVFFKTFRRFYKYLLKKLNISPLENPIFKHVSLYID